MTQQRILTGGTGFAAMWHACTLHGTQPDAADHERISLRYLIARGKGRAPGMEAVNATLDGPLEPDRHPRGPGPNGAAVIRKNTVLEGLTVLTTEAALQEGREAQLAGDPWTAVEIFEDLAAREPANARGPLLAGQRQADRRRPERCGSSAMEDARILHTFPLVARDGRRCGPLPRPTGPTPHWSLPTSTPAAWWPCRH